MSQHARHPSASPSSRPPTTPLSTKSTVMNFQNADQSPSDRGNVLYSMSYAPATRTTVTTTTTTTSISFPPVVVKTPRNLRERDPKQYPLAATPTPSALREFSFDYNGIPALFQEEDDAVASIAKYTEQQEILAKANGITTSTFTTDTQYGKPSEPSVWSHASSTSPLNSTARKRPAPESTPVSLKKAAAIVKAEQPLKRRRHDQADFEASDMENLGNDDFVAPDNNTRRSARARRPKTAIGSSRLRVSHSPVDDFDSPETIAGPPSPPSFTTGPGMAATPPVAESDMEPANIMSPESQIPNDTISIIAQQQGPVLPSPLLSPVTAAATPILPDNSGNLIPNGDVSPFPDEHENLETALIRAEAENSVQTASQTFFGVRDIVESFDSLPDKVQTYVMYQLLRRCNKPTLHFVADMVNPALKRDFLTQLPLELAVNIIGFLDVKTLCRAAQVSKQWRYLINSDDKTWKDLLKKDEFVMPPGELEQAKREGWQWQGLEAYEGDFCRDIRAPDLPRNLRLSTTQSSRGIKRKSTTKSSINKRRKTRHGRPTSQYTELSSPTAQTRPEAVVNRTLDPALTADVAEFGLKTLRTPHLYKTIYRRHHEMRKSWMDGTAPLHLAFRAHDRHVVTCLQFDHEKIITGSDDTKIHVYNACNGGLRRVLHGHEGGVWALQYDGNTLVSGSTDRTVRVWDIHKGTCVHTFQGHTSTVRCLVILKPTPIGKRSDGTDIMMPKEPLIITGSRDSSLRIWKLPKAGDRPYHQSANIVDEEDNPYFVRLLTGHLSSVRAIAARGDTLVSGSYDSTVRVWRISTGETVHRLTGHTQKVYSVILDNDRNRCISGSMDNSVKVWSLASGACLLTLEGHTSLVGLLDLNHDRLVSAAADSTLRIWDPETGQCKSTLLAHTGAITCFQHDGQKVISGSDRTLKMWNVKSGEYVKNLLTGLSGVWQVKFDERKCVAAVQRNNWTYIEILDFGASRDGVPQEKLGVRTLVDEHGDPVDDYSDDEDLDDQV